MRFFNAFFIIILLTVLLCKSMMSFTIEFESFLELCSTTNMIEMSARTATSKSK